MVGRDNIELHFGKSDNGSMKSNSLSRKIGVDVYIWTADLDELFEELKNKQINILEGPVKRPYGREIVIADCNGFKIAFGD